MTDNGHSHGGGDAMGVPAAMICTVWGGQNKIDALFNDRSHTYSVEAIPWTAISPANVRILMGAESNHNHFVSSEGSHTHQAEAEADNGHNHALHVDSVGGDVPLNVQPPYLTTYTYIRS